MPTSKKRVTITLTGQLERDLDIIWTAYPNLKGNALETIVFVLTIKASEILTGQSPRPQVQQPADQSKTEIQAPTESNDQGEEEWSDD
ncbi:hypothetical protein [Leptolyngbya sp. GGD]|uniref:hypothetical protein n=1 Tax=Leptolyngbya sp. GGD TaxID=2997907 RepID=UPI00227D1166|nr:hypothetical protein [Leptolyngbya sp. GGD]MCY6493142.1 hypothetical protein [Leptolyngbya sp. GGD]